ncbi:MAG: flagellar export chaperone FlgN [Desulfovibrionaceae bacterium]
MNYVIESLERQYHAFILLSNLLEEERAILQSAKPDMLVQTSFAIKELVEQIDKERISLKQYTNGSVLTYIESFSEENKESVMELVEKVRTIESAIKEMASMNIFIAQGMVSQSHKDVEFIQEQMSVRENIGYISSGELKKKTVQGNFLEGRS